MTLAIFVARDPAEVDKYQEWFEKYVINESYAVEYNYTSDSFGGSGGITDPNAPKDRTPQSCSAYKKRMSDDFLVLMIKKTVAFPSPEGFQSDSGKRHEIVRQLGEVAKDALNREGIVNATDVEVLIFIHWGGGEPLVYEREFSVPMKNFEFKNATAFAVSSRRRRCFDVTGEMITIPDTKEKLKELVGRFTFDLVKDVMLRYVLENEDCRDEPAKEPGKFEVNSVDAPLLQRYLDYMQKNQERWSGASMLIKMLLRQIGVLLKQREDGLKETGNGMGKDWELKLNDQTSALFSYILREEVRHG